MNRWLDIFCAKLAEKAGGLRYTLRLFLPLALLSFIPSTAGAVVTYKFESSGSEYNVLSEFKFTDEAFAAGSSSGEMDPSVGIFNATDLVDF